MGPLGQAQITFKRAARGADVTEKRLRNWLDNGQIALQGDADRSEGQWRRFSLIDVVRIAVIGAIVRYGFTVDQASDVVRECVDRNLAMLATFQNAPRGALLAGLRGVTITMSYDVADGELYGVRLTRGSNDKPRFDDLSHFAFFDVGKIADAVLARLPLAAISDEDLSSEDDD